MPCVHHEATYSLLPWQRDAYNTWMQNSCRGTIKAATGTGKTLVGIEALIRYSGGHACIVVPTIALMYQWRDEIMKYYPGLTNKIGLVGDGYDQFYHLLVIAVVNSVRDRVIKTPLLIMDEVHRYGSEHNIRFLTAGHFNAILGLSATPERTDGRHEDILRYAPIVYSYEINEAVQDDALSPFHVVFVGVDLDHRDRERYETIQRHIKNSRPADVRSMSFGELDYGLRLAYTERRELLCKCACKKEAAARIIALHYSDKIVVFSEYTDTTDELEKRLSAIYRCVKYHSKLGAKERKRALQVFRDYSPCILITVKALDEGLDVPNANIGIIVAGTKVKRQTIQRLGRILRKKEGKNAIVYVLYCLNTIEYFDMKSKETILRDAADSIEWREITDYEY